MKSSSAQEPRIETTDRKSSADDRAAVEGQEVTFDSVREDDSSFGHRGLHDQFLGRLERARHQGPLALYTFLHDMPKGADLHTHLAGAVYAESFIREAAEDNLCVKAKTLALYKTAATTRSLPPQPVCGEGVRRFGVTFEQAANHLAVIGVPVVVGIQPGKKLAAGRIEPGRG